MDHELDRRLLLGAAGLVGMAAVGKLASAGPLNPPAGAVGSTGRTLLEVEPRVPIGPTTTPGTATAVYRISQPGSYYLTGNVQGVAGKHGIEITVSGVSIDLMGFEVRGVGGPLGEGGNFNGISIGFSLQRFAVRNGTLTAWGGAGFLSNSPGCVLEGLIVSACETGLWGHDGPITGCTAVGNGVGIATIGACAVSQCVAAKNLEAGFQLGNASVCTGCVSQENQGAGFSLSNGVIATECVGFDNAAAGFSGLADATVERCRADRNGAGIVMTQSGRVVDCHVVSNAGTGISAGGRGVVTGNMCSGNRPPTGTGYGILVNGSGSRVEGNYVSLSTTGIMVSGTRNLIVRNCVFGNLEFGYSIPTGNMFGPNVFNQAALNSATNPHANYEI